MCVCAFECAHLHLRHLCSHIPVKGCYPHYLAPQLRPAVEYCCTTLDCRHVHVPSLPPPQLRINFNITMLALPCDYASVDVLDLLGTNKVNMTKNIVKVRTCALVSVVLSLCVLDLLVTRCGRGECTVPDMAVSVDTARHLLPLVHVHLCKYTNTAPSLLADDRSFAPCALCRCLVSRKRGVVTVVSPINPPGFPYAHERNSHPLRRHRR